MKQAIVYLNGEYLPEGAAFIPVTDRGFLFGDGVFTTIKVDEGRPRFLEQHLEKLERDCEMIGIVPHEISPGVIEGLIEKNLAYNGVWRLKIILSGGTGSELSLDTRSGNQLITLKPYIGHISPCRLTCYPYPICHPKEKVKSLAYLDRLWIVDFALKNGFDDALVFNHDGIVLETSVANIFWKYEGELFYPEPALPLYYGVTLQMLLDAAESMGYKGYAVQARLEDIPNDAQLYLCNSMRGFVPIVTVDGRVYARDESFEMSLQLSL